MRIKDSRTSMEALPVEIIHVIFVRLPIKCLRKCRAVCKSWNSIISTSSFIDTHLQLNRGSSDSQLLLLQAKPLAYTRYIPLSLHKDNPSFDEYTQLRNPFLSYDRSLPERRESNFLGYRIDVVGTCNGLVCLVAHDDFTALIWNPSIRRFVSLGSPGVPVNSIITKLGNCRASYAFGYVSYENDYKVSRTVTYFGASRSSCDIAVWSLARGSWKSLDVKSVVLPGEVGPYPKRFLHGAHAFVVRSRYELNIVKSR